MTAKLPQQPPPHITVYVTYQDICLPEPWLQAKPLRSAEPLCPGRQLWEAPQLRTEQNSGNHTDKAPEKHVFLWGKNSAHLPFQDFSAPERLFHVCFFFLNLLILNQITAWEFFLSPEFGEVRGVQKLLFESANRHSSLRYNERQFTIY